MKFAVAVGGSFKSKAHIVHDAMKKAGIDPAFYVYCFPKPEKLSWSNPIRSLRGIYRRVVPFSYLKKKHKEWIPDVDEPVHYCKGINTPEFTEIVSNGRPDAVVVVECGIVSRKTCETFPSLLLNVHAGELPEFRGMNNIEWAYWEDKPLIGTVHYIVPGIDMGDVVYQEELPKLNGPTSIADVREDAFQKVFALVPKALKAIEEGEAPRQQTRERTTRYRMHSVLRNALERKLSAKS